MRKMIVLIFVLVLGCTAVGNTPISNVDMENNRADQRKIDSRLLAQINQSDLKAGETLSVLIRTQCPIQSNQQAQLEKAGVMVGTVVGDILTATLQVSAIFEVAKFEFIVYIEKARKVQLR